LTAIWQPAHQVVILVGGKGTRLGALAKDSPKPLMRIDESTVFLDDVIFNLARQGFSDVLLLAGHLAEKIIDRYDGKSICGARIKVLKEPEPAGTAGALLNAADALQESFLLANGDTLFDVNVRHLDKVLWENPEVTGVMALRRVEDSSRYGTVEIEDGYLKGFHEKHASATGEGLINAGIGLFRKSILSYISKNPSSIELDVYPQLVVGRHLMGHEFSGYFIDIGLPETLEEAQATIPSKRARPALFLDRDGVINEDNGYTHRADDLRFIDCAVDIIRHANDMGALVVVVTNQAGVAHGYYELGDVEAFHRAMNDELHKNAAFIDSFYLCPFHPAASKPAYLHPDHPDRKPNPGMLLRALQDWPIVRERSILIGDKESDIVAAQRAGIRGIKFNGGSLSSLAHTVFQHLGGQGI